VSIANRALHVATAKFAKSPAHRRAGLTLPLGTTSTTLGMTLMPIGRFATASRLSIKAPRIYDQSGLLPAAYVASESGYRYYRPEQLKWANTIRTLRGIDLPLTEIAD